MVLLLGLEYFLGKYLHFFFILSIEFVYYYHLSHVYAKFILVIYSIKTKNKRKCKSFVSQDCGPVLQTVDVQQKEREHLLPKSHLLICSSICLTNMDSPPARGSGSGQVSPGGGPLDSGLLRPSRERTRLDLMSRMVSE